MARKFRLPLLGLLLGLTIVFVVTPATVMASPQCSDTEGHFSKTDPVCGWSSAECNPFYTIYGIIGTQHYEWDCVRQEDGSLAVENVVYNSPNFCTCGYGRMMICSGDFGANGGPCAP